MEDAAAAVVGVGVGVVVWVVVVVVVVDMIGVMNGVTERIDEKYGQERFDDDGEREERKRKGCDRRWPTCATWRLQAVVAVVAEL